jgi:anti-sigma B factor antagonist
MQQSGDFRTQPGPQEDFGTQPGPQEDFRTYSLNGLTVISTPDYLDISNVHQLCAAIINAATDAMVVVVDMAATTFCDATGLGGLVRMNRWLTENYVELRLVSCTERVHKVMSITSLDHVLPLFDNLTEAVTMPPQRDWWTYRRAA